MSNYSYLKKHRAIKRKRTLSSSISDVSSKDNTWEVTPSFSDCTGGSIDNHASITNDVSIQSGKLEVSDNICELFNDNCDSSDAYVNQNVGDDLERNSIRNSFDVSMPLASSSILENSKTSHNSNSSPENVSNTSIRSNAIALSHE